MLARDNGAYVILQGWQAILYGTVAYRTLLLKMVEVEYNCSAQTHVVDAGVHPIDCEPARMFMR